MSRAPRASRLLEQTLELPARGSMRIAAIADTHSRPHPNAAALIAAAKPDLLLHAGDIGALECLGPFESLAPLLSVRGNIDARADGPDIALLTVQGPDGYQMRLLMTHIAVYGVCLRRDARELAARHRAQLLVCGHSHIPFLAEERGVLVFNPGSIGPRRFALPICFGLIELGPSGVSLQHIDCETGEPWRPPAC